jgi:hypothetical protein
MHGSVWEWCHIGCGVEEVVDSMPAFSVRGGAYTYPAHDVQSGSRIDFDRKIDPATIPELADPPLDGKQPNEPSPEKTRPPRTTIPYDIRYVAGFRLARTCP